MEILRTFFDLLALRKERNLGLLSTVVVIMVGLERSVASIMPVLSAAADPTSVQENAYLNWTYETLGFEDTNSFLIALGIAALVAIVVSNAFRNLTPFVSDVSDRLGYAQKVEPDLGWMPDEKFASGFQETMQWYLSNIDRGEAVKENTYDLGRLGICGPVRMEIKSCFLSFLV